MSPSSQREPPAVRQPERVDAGGAVERRGDRRAPVDHHRVVVTVLDVPATDVPPVAGLVDPPEELAGAWRAEILERLGDGDLDVLLRDLVGGAVRVDRLEPLDHRVAARARVGQPLALALEVREQVRVHGAHERYRRGVFSFTHSTNSPTISATTSDGAQQPEDRADHEAERDERHDRDEDPADQRRGPRSGSVGRTHARKSATRTRQDGGRCSSGIDLAHASNSSRSPARTSSPTNAASSACSVHRQISSTPMPSSVWQEIISSDSVMSLIVVSSVLIVTPTPARAQPGEGVVGEPLDGPGLDVARGAQVERDASADELVDQRRVGDGRRTVRDPVGPELERPAHQRAVVEELAGVHGDAQPAVPRDRERLGVHERIRVGLLVARRGRSR